MNKVFEKILEKLNETDFNDIQIVIREVLLKYGFPYESVVQDEVWNALDELSTNKFVMKIVNEIAEEYNNGWIPCSERLPEGIGRYYIVSVKSAVSEVSYSRPALYEKDGFCTKIDEEVIAWQQLPEPYKEGNDNVESN